MYILECKERSFSPNRFVTSGVFRYTVTSFRRCIALPKSWKEDDIVLLRRIEEEEEELVPYSEQSDRSLLVTMDNQCTVTRTYLVLSLSISHAS